MNWLKLSETKKLVNAMQILRNHYEDRKHEDFTRSGFSEDMQWYNIIDSVRKRLAKDGRNPDLSGSVLSVIRKLTGSGNAFSEYAFMKSQIFMGNPFFVLFHSGVHYENSRG